MLALSITVPSNVDQACTEQQLCLCIATDEIHGWARTIGV